MILKLFCGVYFIALKMFLLHNVEALLVYGHALIREYNTVTYIVDSRYLDLAYLE